MRKFKCNATETVYYESEIEIEDHEDEERANGLFLQRISMSMDIIGSELSQETIVEHE